MKFTPNPNFAREIAREAAMGAFLKSVADDAASQVRPLVPVDDGTLRDSVTSDVEMTRDGFQGVVKVGGRKAFYWHWIEFGTSREGARPFLRPGVQSAIGRLGGRLGESR